MNDMFGIELFRPVGAGGLSGNPSKELKPFAKFAKYGAPLVLNQLIKHIILLMSTK